SRLRAPLRGAALGEGASALVSAAAVYGDDLPSSAALAAISPSMTSGSRRASRLTGAPAGPAEASFISSSTIASRSRFSRGPIYGTARGKGTRQALGATFGKAPLREAFRQSRCRRRRLPAMALQRRAT